MFKGVRFLTKFCWKFNKKFIIFKLLESISKAVTPLLAIIIPKFIIDELMGQQRLEVLLFFILALVGSVFLGNALTETLSMGAFLNKNKAFKEMQLYLTENLFDADYSSIESVEFLDIKDKASKFLYGNGRGFASIFDDFSSSLSSIINFLGIIVIIGTLNIWIIGILIALVLVSALFDSKFAKEMYKIDMEKVPIERRGQYISQLTEDFKYGKEVRIFNLKNWILEKYKVVLEQSNNFYKKAYMKAIKNTLLKQSTSFIEQLVMYLYLVFAVISNAIGIGDFTMYIGAISSFSNSMKTLMNNFVTISQYDNYYKELDAFLNMPKTMREGKQIKLKDANIKSQIEFRNVSFKYPGQRNYTIRNISMTIGVGESLSIVGENGAGKTTFIKLLLRLYDPTEGEILLDGKNIKDIDYDDYMKVFSVVFQDFELFAFNIKENVSLNEMEDDYSKVIQCIKDSGLEQKVDSLEKGIFTNVYKIFDTEGIELSGGQGQKLALARAMYKNAPVVILDEPTAALDPRAEFELYSNFNKIANNKTVIYISHRLSSSRFCDNIAVFKDGQIIEYGSHDDLLQQDGLYAELFSMQANSYIELSNKKVI